MPLPPEDTITYVLVAPNPADILGNDGLTTTAPQGGGQSQDPPIVSRSQEQQGSGEATSTGTAQTKSEGQPQDLRSCLTSQLPLILGMVAIFYFLLIRPQQQQEKKRKELLSALKKGDRVVTNGGLHGTIEKVQEETVALRIDSDVQVTIDRAAIGRVLGDPAAAKDEGAKS
jgi:preprotein translocase subunit YajC